MKLEALLGATPLPRRPREPGTFELTDLDCYVDEEVLREILKDKKLRLTFHHVKIMVILIASSVIEAQYSYIENKYKNINRKKLSNDNVSSFLYNPLDKHIYVTIHYKVNEQQDPRDIHVSFKVGKGAISMKIIDDAEVEKIKASPDAIHLFKLMSTAADL